MFSIRDRIPDWPSCRLMSSLNISCSPPLKRSIVHLCFDLAMLRRHLVDGLFEQVGDAILLLDPGFLLGVVSLFDLLIAVSALLEHGVRDVVPGQPSRADRSGKSFEKDRIELAEVLDQTLPQLHVLFLQVFIFPEELLIPLGHHMILFEQLIEFLYDLGILRVAARADSLTDQLADLLSGLAAAFPAYRH